MKMDHHQEMASSQSLESMMQQVSSKPQLEKKPRPPEQSLKCPRCDSTNTKFCYYNNYSLSQPRYFCKSCRRYWTKGGTLRNVPVGGGCRKNTKRSSSCSGKRTHDHHQPPLITTATTSNHHMLLPPPLPPLSYEYPSSSNDLTLAFQVLLGGSHAFQDHPNNAQFDSIIDQGHDFGVLNSIRGNVNFLDNDGGFYYEENDHGRDEMGVMGSYEEMMASAATTPTSSSVTTATAMKQEVCENGGGSEGEDQSRGFWGLPWQINGGGGNMNGGGSGGGNVDSVRSESCWTNINGFVNAPWHGLLNSPLM